MVIERLKNLEGNSRRHFLRFAAAAGAVYGLDRARVLDVVSGSAGSAMADDSCATTNRSIHIIGGNGGFSWFQLLFPHVEIATSTDPSFAFHAQGQAIKATDTDNPFYFAPETPWQKLDKGKRVSAFMAGTNQTHTTTPSTAATLGAGQSLLAGVAAIQRATPSLLPVIGLTPISFGSAPGAPDVATVANADGMVQLFNSAASQAILQQPADAALFEAYYKAFAGFDRAAGRPTWAAPLRTGKASANFLGKNLATQLAPAASDLTNYGIDSGTPTKLSEIGKALITSVRAFKLGLTQAVVIPAMMDDPHGAFADMPTLLATVKQLGGMLDQFMSDMAQIQDPVCSNTTLADNLVITVHGDTPKDPRNRDGWPDGTPDNSNWLYVMGNGYLKTGWFGGVHADGSTSGFDPTSGKDMPGQSADTTSAAAGAAAAYAVAKGDIKRVQDFYTGPALDGIINANPLLGG
jgi:hypothetical protein